MYARDYGNTPGTVKAFEEAYARQAMQSTAHTVGTPHEEPRPAEKPSENLMPCANDTDTTLLLLLLFLLFG